MGKNKGKISGNDSNLIQNIALLYIVVWTISPFMDVDMVWRIGAVAAVGVWFVIAHFRGLVLDKIQWMAISFALLVMFVNIIEYWGISKILSPIGLYMLVILFIMYRFYEGRWNELKWLIPVVLILLTFFNIRSFVAVSQDPNIARQLVRDNETVYQYSRQGIGGYGLIYPQVVCFPVILNWTACVFKKNRVYFTLGLIWTASYITYVINASYSIAIFASIIGVVILYLYKGVNIAGAFVITIGLFIGLMLLIMYNEGFRNFLLEMFDGTAIDKKIRDLTGMSDVGEVNTIQARIDEYAASLLAIVSYPFIGSLWWSTGGSHSTFLLAFSKYGVFGGYVFCKMIYAVPLYYKKNYRYRQIIRLANANLVALLFVTIFDTVSYQFIGMILLVTPLLYDDIVTWGNYEADLELQKDKQKRQINKIKLNR